MREKEDGSLKNSGLFSFCLNFLKLGGKKMKARLMLVLEKCTSKGERVPGIISYELSSIEDEYLDISDKEGMGQMMEMLVMCSRKDDDMLN